MREERLSVVKKEIRSVVITYPKGVFLHAFLKAYQQLVGVRLPSREFGFTSDVDFLYSLSDVVKVETDRNGDIVLKCITDESTEHIQKLVSKQRVVKTKSKNVLDRGPREKVPSNVRHNKLFVSAALRKFLFEVLKDFPDGINYNSLLLAYQRKFRRPLNLDFLSESHYDRLRKLEMTVPELKVKVVDEVERLFYCPLTRKNETKKQEEKVPFKSLIIPDTSGEQRSGAQSEEIPIIPCIVKEDFEKVLKLYPDGVLARHFPLLYEKMSGDMFDLADLGFNDFLELADALPDIFVCVKPYEKPNEWMVFHTCFAENARKLIKMNHALELSEERFGRPSEVQNQELPLDIALQPYAPPEFPRDHNLSVFFPIFITAATSPGCFCFKLEVQEVIYRFKELEDRLQGFYHNESADAYKMAPKDIKIGTTCVAMHEDHWYRTTITSSPSGELVTVYLVDYGGWEKVHYSRLRYLKNSYISLPAQAFKAQLALLKPINDCKTWSKRATVRFLQLCLKNYIMAQVHLEFVDTLSVFLCDTTGDEDIYINDVLVNENLAQKCSDRSAVSNGHTSADEEGRRSYAETQRFAMNGKDGNSISSSPLAKRVYLGDGYWTNIIMMSKVAYMTATDLCRLFWQDKSAEVLKSRLQCKNVEIDTTTICRDDHNDFFLKCENNGFEGFSPQQESIELYPLSAIMKVLNSLGHPSKKIRETLQMAMKDQNNLNALLESSTHSNEVSVNGSSTKDDLNNLCLYDLKAMHEAVKFKRLLLQKKSSQNQNTDLDRDLLKAGALLRTIQQRIENIDSICSFYSCHE